MIERSGNGRRALTEFKCQSPKVTTMTFLSLFISEILSQFSATEAKEFSPVEWEEGESRIPSPFLTFEVIRDRRDFVVVST